MKNIDQYSVVMVVLTLVLLGAFLLTHDAVLLDLVKVAFGATLGTLAKKAETIVVADSATSKAIVDNLLDPR